MSWTCCCRSQLLEFYASSGDFTRRLTSVKANGKFSSPSAGAQDYWTVSHEPQRSMLKVSKHTAANPSCTRSLKPHCIGVMQCCTLCHAGPRRKSWDLTPKQLVLCMLCKLMTSPHLPATTVEGRHVSAGGAGEVGGCGGSPAPAVGIEAHLLLAWSCCILERCCPRSYSQPTPACCYITSRHIRLDLLIL